MTPHTLQPRGRQQGHPTPAQAEGQKPDFFSHRMALLDTQPAVPAYTSAIGFGRAGLLPGRLNLTYDPPFSSAVISSAGSTCRMLLLTPLPTRAAPCCEAKRERTVVSNTLCEGEHHHVCVPTTCTAPHDEHIMQAE